MARLIHERVDVPRRLVGVDINPAMVAVGRSLAPYADCGQGDATTLEFGDAEFDLVLCQHGLMFFPDRSRALAEMRRVLTRQGRIGVSTWRPLSENPLSEAFTRAGRRLVDAPIDLPWALGDAGELQAMVEAAGFGEVRVDTVEVVAHFPDARVFTRMSVLAFGAVLPGFAAMSDSARSTFITTIEAETADLMAQHREGDGVKFPVRANLVTGKSR